MDWILLSEVVGDVGFPIMIATVLVYQNKASNDAFFKLYCELKDTIDKNTQAISELSKGLRDRNT